MSNVRARRKALGLTLRDLSEQTGIAFSWISSVEREVTPRAISLRHARAIARVLGAPVDDLFPPNAAEIDERRRFRCPECATVFVWSRAPMMDDDIRCPCCRYGDEARYFDSASEPRP